MDYIFDHSLQRARAQSPELIDGADEPLRGRTPPAARTAAEKESIGLYGLPRTTPATSSPTLDLDEAYGNLRSGNPLQQLETLRRLQQDGLLSDDVVAEKQRELLDRALIGGGHAAQQDSLPRRQDQPPREEAAEEGEPPSLSNPGVSHRPFDSSSTAAATDARIDGAHDALPPWLVPAPIPYFGHRPIVEQHVYDRNHDGGALWAITGASTTGPPSSAASEYGSRSLQLEPEMRPDQRPRLSWVQAATIDGSAVSCESRASHPADSLELSPEVSRDFQSFGAATSPTKRERKDAWENDASRSHGSPAKSPTEDMKQQAGLHSRVDDGTSGAQPKRRGRRRADDDDDISPKPTAVPAEVIIAHLDYATDGARFVAQVLDARQEQQGSPLGS